MYMYARIHVHTYRSMYGGARLDAEDEAKDEWGGAAEGKSAGDAEGGGGGGGFRARGK
jgi:hypothetical protein